MNCFYPNHLDLYFLDVHRGLIKGLSKIYGRSKKALAETLPQRFSYIPFKTANFIQNPRFLHYYPRNTRKRCYLGDASVYRERRSMQIYTSWKTTKGNGASDIADTVLTRRIISRKRFFVCWRSSMRFYRMPSVLMAIADTSGGLLLTMLSRLHAENRWLWMLK